MPTTLPKFTERAAQFQLSGVEIAEVDPGLVRITTAHSEDERFKRRGFWLWLFTELYGAPHLTDDTSCTFFLREEGKPLPPTLGDNVRRMFRLPIIPRMAPDTQRLIAVQDVSLARRNRGAICKGFVSFSVSREEARRLRELGVEVSDEPHFGRYEVLVRPTQMLSITVPVSQIFFLWLA